MVSTNIITAANVLGFIALILILITTAVPQWRVSSQVASQQNMIGIRALEGIWIRCTSYNWQHYQCDRYDTALIGLPAYLNAFRAFMIISFLCSMAGVVCSALGMKCAHALKEDSKGKRWVVIIGGVCHMIAGILTGISVSWYAAEVVREYYSPYYQTQKLRYTLGVCLYLGWVAMLLSLIAGCLMTCCTCFSQPADKATYSYKPPVSSGQGFSSYPAPAAYKPSSEPYKARDDSYKYRSGSHDRYNSKHQGSQKSSRHERQVDYV